MKLLQKNREFAQFFLAVALKKTAVTTAQLLQFVAYSSITLAAIRFTFQKIKIKQIPGCRNLIFHDNFIQCSTEKFSFFAQHFGGNHAKFHEECSVVSSAEEIVPRL